MYHAVRGGQHAPAELKFVTNKGRQAAITSSAPGSFNRANGQPLRDSCISGASGLCHTRSEGTSSEDTRSEDNRFGNTSPSRKASGIASSGSYVVFFVYKSVRSCVLWCSHSGARICSYLPASLARAYNTERSGATAALGPAELVTEPPPLTSWICPESRRVSTGNWAGARGRARNSGVRQ